LGSRLRRPAGANTTYFWRSVIHRSSVNARCGKQVSLGKEKFKNSFFDEVSKKS
jgi:hypothetical protein